MQTVSQILETASPATQRRQFAVKRLPNRGSTPPSSLKGSFSRVDGVGKLMTSGLCGMYFGQWRNVFHDGGVGRHHRIGADGPVLPDRDAHAQVGTRASDA